MMIQTDQTSKKHPRRKNQPMEYLTMTICGGIRSMIMMTITIPLHLLMKTRPLHIFLST